MSAGSRSSAATWCSRIDGSTQPVRSCPPVVGGRTILPGVDSTFAAPLADDGSLSATALLEQDAADAVPSVALQEEPPYPLPSSIAATAVATTWAPRGDLLASGPYARDFVVEMDELRRAHLRFGDGASGLRPEDGTTMTATYRLGGGSEGRVAPGALCCVVDGTGALAPITWVENPFAAMRASPPEDIEVARRAAPNTLDDDDRCVTTGDYCARARQYPGVVRAAADLVWSGSRALVRVYVDRGDQLTADDAFCAEVRSFLSGYAVTGTTVIALPARRVPLEVTLQLTVAAKTPLAVVRAGVDSRIGQRLGFRPAGEVQRLGFGEPVEASDLIALALDVEGVTSVLVRDFRRASQPGPAVAAGGAIPLEATEIAWVANDPTTPGNGQLQLEVSAS